MQLTPVNIFRCYNHDIETEVLWTGGEGSQGEKVGLVADTGVTPQRPSGGVAPVESKVQRTIWLKCTVLAGGLRLATFAVRMRNAGRLPEREVGFGPTAAPFLAVIGECDSRNLMVAYPTILKETVRNHHPAGARGVFLSHVLRTSGESAVRATAMAAPTEVLKFEAHPTRSLHVQLFTGVANAQ